MSSQKNSVHKALALFKFYTGALETGKVTSVKDGVAKVIDLFGGMIYLGINKMKGIVLSL
jgi:hypothetical protein